MTQQNQNQPARRLIPEGTYRVRAVNAKFGTANTGTEQIGVQLEVVEGDHKGAMLVWYGYFTPATEERSIESMRYLGWKGNDILDLSTMYQGEALAVVEHETDNEGTTRAKVQWINGIGVAMKNVMEGAELTRFAQRIRGLAARVGGAAAQDTSGGRNSLPPVNRGGGNQQQARGNEPPPPDDRDAPPWAGRGGGGQQQGGYRR